MKILFIASGTFWGGGSKALFNLAKYLADRDNQIAIVFPEKNNQDIFIRLKESNIKFYVTHVKYGLTIKPNSRFLIKNILQHFNVLRTLLARIEVAKIIREFQPDIVHTNVGPLNLALKTCQKLGIPHVWHLREYQDLDFNLEFFPSKGRFMELTHQKGNFNIAITKQIFSYWNLRDCDEVIYDGVFDSNNISKIPSGSMREPIILFAGRIEKTKGPHILIESFSRLYHQHFDLIRKYKVIIAGYYEPDSEYFKYCQRLISSNRLQDKVKFVGQIKDINVLMAKSSLVVVPSINEGFGFVSVEAMINKCPTVLHYSAGLKEQVDFAYEKLGQYIAYTYEDPIDLDRAILKALTTNNENMIEKAYHFCFENYSIQKHGEQVLKFYNKCLHV